MGLRITVRFLDGEVLDIGPGNLTTDQDEIHYLLKYPSKNYLIPKENVKYIRIKEQ